MKKQPKKEKKQVIEIHIYVHQEPVSVPQPIYPSIPRIPPNPITNPIVTWGS